MVELVPTGELHPAPWNPRAVEQRRHAAIRLSIDKLGFLLPLIADPDGALISGHQRLRAARELGWSAVPVVRPSPRRIPALSLNLIANRATNDQARSAKAGSLSDDDTLDRFTATAARLPSLAPGSPEALACLTAAPEPLGPLLAATLDRLRESLNNTARSAAVAGIPLPVVIAGNRVVNGLGRIHHAAERGATTIDAIRLPDALAPAAELALNRLSQSFDLQAVADLIRPNARRLEQSRRRRLGWGFLFRVHRGVLKTFDPADPDHRRRWFAEHGHEIVDFGSGHGVEADILTGMGARVIRFEPYPTRGNQVDLDRSRLAARQFLERIAAGPEFDSIFLSSVLNSVPFARDRQHIVRICAALALPGGRLFIATRGRHSANVRALDADWHLNEKHRRINSFPLDDEPGTTLGNLLAAPKIQKFHAPAEIEALLQPVFAGVEAGIHQQNVVAVAARPRPVDWDQLAAAIAFEFDLPFPDGSRMGLADLALAVFRARLARVTS